MSGEFMLLDQVENNQHIWTNGIPYVLLNSGLNH